MNKIIVLAILLLSFSLQAAPISTTEILNNWIRVEDPAIEGQNINNWTSSGSSLFYSSNSGGGIVSNFLVSNFQLSARVVNSGDNDIYGLIFGFVDDNNQYRLSWEGGGHTDHGFRGLVLMREIAGTDVSLFNMSNLLWQNGVSYDITVSRTGNNLGVNVQQVGGGTLANFSVVDNSFLTGRVGFYTSSQATLFSNVNLNSSAIPEPGTLALGTFALLALALGMRKKS